MKRGFWLAQAGWMLLLWGGCAESSWRAGGSIAPAAAVPPHKLWRAYGNLKNPGQAIDGDRLTAAVAADRAPGASLTIDLGGAAAFNMVILDHGGDAFGSGRRVALHTSMDGKTFAKIHEAPGTRRITYLCPITPMLARYLRVSVTVPGGRPWSVAEVYVR